MCESLAPIGIDIGLASRISVHLGVLIGADLLGSSSFRARAIRVPSSGTSVTVAR